METKLLISEILEHVEKATTTEDKVAVLKTNDCRGLRDVLRGSLDDSIQWNLPLGMPKLESVKARDGSEPSDLKRRTVEFMYLFKGGPGDKMAAYKRENIFLGIAEGVAPKDAELVVLMKDKKLGTKYPSVTKDLVNAAWPKLIAL